MRTLLARTSSPLGLAFGLALSLGVPACGGSGAVGPNDGPTATTDGGPTTTPAPDMALAADSSLSYALASQTLQPGDEKLFCQYFPPDGKEHWINRFVTDLSPGSHHLIVFRVKNPSMTTAQGPFDCLNVDFPQGITGLLPGSQTQHADVTLPDGVAMKLGADEGLYFQEHYINASSAPITTKVTWAVGTVDLASVKQSAGVLFYSNFGLKVPPGKSQTTQTCKAPHDLQLLTSTGHMHRRGLTFDATIAGKAVYHTESWDSPDNTLYPAPGYAVKQGDPISWTCAYDNQTMTTFTYGNSAVTNEMCILAGIFYPSPDSATEFVCNQ